MFIKQGFSNANLLSHVTHRGWGFHIWYFWLRRTSWKPGVNRPFRHSENYLIFLFWIFSLKQGKQWISLWREIDGKRSSGQTYFWDALTNQRTAFSRSGSRLRKATQLKPSSRSRVRKISPTPYTIFRSFKTDLLKMKKLQVVAYS